MNQSEPNHFFSAVPDNPGGAQPPEFVTLSKGGLVFGVLTAAVLVLTLWMLGAFSWWQRGLWAAAVAVCAAFRLHAGPAATAWSSRVCFALCPIAAFWMVETLSGRDVLALAPSRLLLNLLLCGLAALVLWLVLGRAKLAAGTVLVLFWAAGMANRYALRLSGRTIVPGSVPDLSTAAVGGLRPDGVQITLTLSVVLVLLVLAALPRQKERAPLGLSSYLAGAVCAALAVLLFAMPAPDRLGLRPDGYDGETDGFVLHFALCLREAMGPEAERYEIQPGQTAEPESRRQEGMLYGKG